MDFFSHFSVMKFMFISGFSNVCQYLSSDDRFYMPALKTVDWEGIGIRLFSIYVTISFYASKFGCYLYNNYPEVKQCVDVSLYSIKYINSKVNNHKIEPLNDNWVRTSFLLKNNETFFTGNKYIYMDNYEYLNTDVNEDYSPKEMIQQGFDYFHNMVKAMCQTNINLIQTMTTLNKNKNYAMSISYDKETNPPNFKAPFREVRNPFISIEYVDSSKNTKIVLEPENCWFIGNSMLSPIHVRQLLEYQERPFQFDLDYTLNIIDSDMNMYSMNKTQYIYINDDGKGIVKELTKEDNVIVETVEVVENNKCESDTDSNETDTFTSAVSSNAVPKPMEVDENNKCESILEADTVSNEPDTLTTTISTNAVPKSTEVDENNKCESIPEVDVETDGRDTPISNISSNTDEN